MRPIRSISDPTTSTSAYIPSTCAPMIGNTSLCVMVVVLDDDVAAEVHHRHHHAEARQRASIAGRTPGRTMISRSGAAGVFVVGVRADPLGDLLRVRPHEQHEQARHECDPAGGEPRHGQRGGVELAAGEQRAEDRRAEDRPEHRAEQHVRDAERAPLRRVHVARRGADQQRDPARRAGEHEAEDEQRRRADVGRQRGQAAAGGGRQIPARDHRPPPDAVHRAARRERRQRRREQEDRRPQPEQAAYAGDEHERDRRHRRHELQHAPSRPPSWWPGGRYYGRRSKYSAARRIISS